MTYRFSERSISKYKVNRAVTIAQQLRTLGGSVSICITAHSALFWPPQIPPTYAHTPYIQIRRKIETHPLALWPLHTYRQACVPAHTCMYHTYGRGKVRGFPSLGWSIWSKLACTIGVKAHRNIRDDLGFSFSTSFSLIYELLLCCRYIFMLQLSV